MHLPINQIIINERQRIDLGNIDELADSIERLTQLQPILVSDNGNSTYTLIAGRRRLAAITSLGRGSIDANVLNSDTIIKLQNLSPTERELFIQECELEEDTKRKDRTWQERCLAYLKLDRLKRSSALSYNDTWTRRKLADLVGKSIGHVVEALAVADALERTKAQSNDWEKGLWACENFYTATQYLAMVNENAAFDEIARRRKEVRQKLGLEKPPEPVATTVATTSTSTTAPLPLNDRPARLVKLYNRQPHPSECAAMLLFDGELDPASFLSVSSAGAIIYWTSSFGLYRTALDELLEHEADYHPLPFPLIWNTVRGPTWKDCPFSMNYRLGLFLPMPDYAYRDEVALPSVMTAPLTGASPPLSIVQHSLDAISNEGDKIYLPNGVAALEVARCNRFPVFAGCPEAVESLKDYYRETYGKVEFQLA